MLVTLQDAELLVITGTEFNVREPPVASCIWVCETVFEHECCHLYVVVFAFGCFEQTDLRLQVVLWEFLSHQQYGAFTAHRRSRNFERVAVVETGENIVDVGSNFAGDIVGVEGFADDVCPGWQ
jgi:hypothetical protein